MPNASAPPTMMEVHMSMHLRNGVTCTEIRSGQLGAWLADFTRDARTVVLTGPPRVFSESGVTVGHSRWVRALPAPFDGTPDPDWLLNALGANAAGMPDILALAMQYMRGAPTLRNGKLRIAGEADYGRLVDGERQEGSDFNDYLGVAWNYPDESHDDPAETCQSGCLDCSGYLRMIWGYRSHLPTGAGVPLCHTVRADRSAIPRRANEIFMSGPGVTVIERTAGRIEDLASVQVGDLVFFDGDLRPSDEGRLDHVGMYIGCDATGRHRFISSRKTHNGPTFADEGGVSTLDGNGHFPEAFRAVRRL